MLEGVYGWRSLYSRHAVEKLGLISLLCQASHFLVFDWLLTSLKYLTQSVNILSIATQVYLPSQCGVAAGFFFRETLHEHLGSSHLMEMVVGSHCMSLLAPLESVLVGPVSAATALDGPTHRHIQSCPILLRLVDGVVV